MVWDLMRGVDYLLESLEVLDRAGVVDAALNDLASETLRRLPAFRRGR